MSKKHALRLAAASVCVTLSGVAASAEAAPKGVTLNPYTLVAVPVAPQAKAVIKAVPVYVPAAPVVASPLTPPGKGSPTTGTPVGPPPPAPVTGGGSPPPPPPPVS